MKQFWFIGTESLDEHVSFFWVELCIFKYDVNPILQFWFHAKTSFHCSQGQSIDDSMHLSKLISIYQIICKWNSFTSRISLRILSGRLVESDWTNDAQIENDFHKRGFLASAVDSFRKVWKKADAIEYF